MVFPLFSHFFPIFVWVFPWFSCDFLISLWVFLWFSSLVSKIFINPILLGGLEHAFYFSRHIKGIPNHPNWLSLTHLFQRGLFNNHQPASYPRCPMFGIFIYIWVICGANEDKYCIHGAYGYVITLKDPHGPSNDPTGRSANGQGSTASRTHRPGGPPVERWNGLSLWENRGKKHGKNMESGWR